MAPTPTKGGWFLQEPAIVPVTFPSMFMFYSIARPGPDANTAPIHLAAGPRTPVQRQYANTERREPQIRVGLINKEVGDMWSTCRRHVVDM